MKKYIISALSVLLFFTSCVDTVLLPDNKTVDEDFWQTKQEVASMVAGCYTSMMSSNMMSRLIVWGDFRSDELIPVTSISNTTEQALNEIYNANIQTDNMFAEWGSVYSVINNCNIILEKASGVMSIDPNYTEGDYLADRSQLLALRSLCYFYLVRTYRDVPYITKAYMNSSQELNAAQTTPDSVLQGCINDLVEAEKNALDPAGYSDWRSKGYINRDAIDALLADIYLWRASVNNSASDYQSCVYYCDKVIASKKANHISLRNEIEEMDYYLSEGYYYNYDLFANQNAEESIFELQYDGSTNSNVAVCSNYYKFANNNSAYGYMRASVVFGQASASAPVFLSSSDYRYLGAVYNPNSSDVYFDIKKMVSHETYIASTKREGTRTYANYAQNWIVYRLTDVMLMKAEALTQLASGNDDIQLRQAFNLVQTVNSRSLKSANLADSLKWNTYSNKEAMETLVLSERQRELCFEGKRWYDLMRYNYRHMDIVAPLDKTMAELNESGYEFGKNSKVMLNLMTRKYISEGSSIQSKMRTEPYLYMPVPKSDMNVNPLLIQNPVYNDNDDYEKNI